MCRSIKRLREGDHVADEDEIRAAAVQFVRKVSGFSKPSARHQPAFDQAVEEITAASERLLRQVATNLAA